MSSTPTLNLFDPGWSRIGGRLGRGGAGAPGDLSSIMGHALTLRRVQHLVRVASGSRQAVVKMIRGGGCASRAELVRQVAYVGTKAHAILDPRGQFQRIASLDRSEVASVAQRFTVGWDPDRTPAGGHTMHLLLSFPRGTSAEAVRWIGQSVADRLLAPEDGPLFDWIGAVHTDRAHPHVHLIVNRRSVTGELFTLRAGTRLSYEAIREAMVEEAALHGIELDAARRTDRGTRTYAVRDADVWRAQRARTASERDALLIEREPERATALRREDAVAAATKLFLGMGLEAGRKGCVGLAEAFGRASLAVARGRSITTGREIDMDQKHEFQIEVRQLEQTLTRLMERLDTVSLDERLAEERRVSDVLRPVQHLVQVDLEGDDAEALAETSRFYRARSSRAVANVALALDAASPEEPAVAMSITVGVQRRAAGDTDETALVRRDLKAVAQARGLMLSVPGDQVEATMALRTIYERADRELSRLETAAERVEPVAVARELDDANADVPATTAPLPAADVLDKQRRQLLDAMRQVMEPAGVATTDPADDQAERFGRGLSRVLEALDNERPETRLAARLIVTAAYADMADGRVKTGAAQRDLTTLRNLDDADRQTTNPRPATEIRLSQLYASAMRAFVEVRHEVEQAARLVRERDAETLERRRGEDYGHD